MGGDNAPAAIIEGAVAAARQLGVRVALVGRTEAVERELARLAPRPSFESLRMSGHISVVDAAEVIEMDEPPRRGSRRSRWRCGC